MRSYNRGSHCALAPVTHLQGHSPAELGGHPAGSPRDACALLTHQETHEIQEGSGDHWVIPERGPTWGLCGGLAALWTVLAHLRRPCHAFQVEKLLPASVMVLSQS